MRIERSSALTSVKSTNGYYPEIDGLRAVAVILVILYHFGYSDFTGGFVGVDVFFVISGYLITGLLIDSPAHHGVGLASFYIRRVKRLAPALLFFLLVCLACGYALLSPGDYTSLAASSLFASVGASNFYFFYHTGYFDPSAQSLPLLHTWSLAIEEQFYLVWPISLFFLRKLCKGRSGLLISILAAFTVVSFCVNLQATATDQKLGFYFPFGRAWELSAGGLLAIFHASLNAPYEVHGRKRRAPLAMQLLPAVGLVLMLTAALAFDEHDPYPGWRALLPVVGTIAYLIPVGQRTLVYGLMASAPPRLVGKASYSIYLYHWSLLTFFRYYTDFTPISPSDRLELVIASLAFGFISWRWIEQPFRYARWTGKLQAALLGGAGLAVAGFSAFIWLNDGLPRRLPESTQTMRSLAVMWEWKCARESGLPAINVYGEDADWNQCESGKPWDHASKKIIVLGDSHATQLMPLITSMIGDRDISIRLLIICSPVLDGVTYVDFNSHTRTLSCRARHEFALDLLKTEPVDVVVLASAWTFIPRQLVHDYNNKTEADDDLSHAASAFYPSPFERALVLTLDGVGEWTTTSVGVGRGAKIEILKELHFPHSLGLLYSAFTYYAGFRVNSGEYKLMGLAPYGQPKYATIIRDKLLDLKEDGSFRVNQAYFDYATGFKMINRQFEELFGQPARAPEGRLSAFHMDIAASIQAVTEEVILHLTRSLARETGERNLCLAGGVALNCVANGKVLRDGQFDQVWVQPAAGDAGGALGAALAVYHMDVNAPRVVSNTLDGMAGAYLGPSYSQPEIEARLAAAGAHFRSLDDETVLEATVDALVDGSAIGWFQGRMEFGPRALGNRSILGDPRNPAMQKSLNLRVKYRESFRPFAPAVLAEDCAEWFEHDRASPYMQFVADIKPERRRLVSDDEKALFGIDKLNVIRSELPAVTHVDYSARLQTVHAETNPRFHALLSRFKARTGCPVLVNTSFNVRGEPIVGTPEDAFRCFMGTDIEMLVIGNCILRKEDQNAALRLDYRNSFPED